MTTATRVRGLIRGTPLHDDFEVIGIIHQGAFGITYLAQDQIHRRHLVVKEYLPTMLAKRGPNGVDVVLKGSHFDAAYKAGLKSFINEARLLAQFQHPALIAVEQLWKANGSAYMALPLVESPTLRAFSAERGNAPDEAELRRWLRQMLEALELLHAAGCVHGDITPDSVLLTETGPLMLGFGGGRHTVATMMHAPADALKTGYAAVEQYELGATPAPATDLYALAAVVYALLTGRAPMAASTRRINDRLPPLRNLLSGRYSDSLITAIDAALIVEPRGRPQDVPAFIALLLGGPMRAVRSVAEPESDDAPNAAAPAAESSLRFEPMPAVASAPVPLASPVVVERRSSSHLRIPLMIAGVLCSLAFGVLAFLVLRSAFEPDPLQLPSTAAMPTTVPVPVPVPAAAPVVAPTQTTTPSAATPATPSPNR